MTPGQLGRNSTELLGTPETEKETRGENWKQAQEMIRLPAIDRVFERIQLMSRKLKILIPLP